MLGAQRQEPKSPLVCTWYYPEPMTKAEVAEHSHARHNSHPVIISVVATTDGLRWVALSLPFQGVETLFN